MDEAQSCYFSLKEHLTQLKTSKIDQNIEYAFKTSGKKPLRELIIGKPEYGANAPSVSLQDGRPRYVRITDIDSNGHLVKEDAVGVELDTEEERHYSLSDGDLLIARTGNTVGKSFLYSKENGICVFAGYLVRFRPNKEKTNPNYLFIVTKSSYYHNWLKNMVRVGAQPNVNGTEYGTLVIPLMSLSDQEKVINKIDEISRVINVCNRCIEILGLLRISLTNAFMEG